MYLRNKLVNSLISNPAYKLRHTVKLPLQNSTQKYGRPIIPDLVAMFIWKTMIHNMNISLSSPIYGELRQYEFKK